jgi:hypothetical protein
MHNVCTHQPEPQKLTDSTDACLPISIYYSRRRTTSFRSVYISFLRSRVVEVDPRARSEKATTSTLYVQVSQYRTLACIYTYAYGRCDGSALAERAESRGIATRGGRWSVVMVLERSNGYTTTGYGVAWTGDGWTAALSASAHQCQSDGTRLPDQISQSIRRVVPSSWPATP